MVLREQCPGWTWALFSTKWSFSWRVPAIFLSSACGDAAFARFLAQAWAKPDKTGFHAYFLCALSRWRVTHAPGSPVGTGFAWAIMLHCTTSRHTKAKI
jgi:hypothetical protein